ncbi:uncharacterized protein LOC125208150 isoform X2 [Salvia hispanica]|uniref:uncharacterized protein LOC125208150 isoform X2 n=1 Tax=Salvia hispanica TaxID=49212 RepID=UPI002009C63A|nr:uncharacterized protein LOC125208150 isoform X2 [Salvia hispanica]
MATETHADNSQEEILSAIKSLRLELHNNRAEYLALSDWADRLFSALEAKVDGDAIFAKLQRPTTEKKAKLRIDPPKFNGDHPSDWIYKVQSYFDYFKTSEEDRLRLVGLLFEHRASNWLLHQHDNNLVTTWPEFLEAVTQRFDPPRALKVTVVLKWS